MRLRSHSANLWIGGRRKLRVIERELHDTYGAPEKVLGNKRDPLSEALYILLTFQTNIPRSKETWRRLRSAFPSWHRVEVASTTQIAAKLRIGGLHRQKARTIKRLLKSTKEMFGRLSLRSIGDSRDKEAEKMLIRLPGLSWKAARCVLLYSFDRKVFPVDGNTFRILKRVGVIAQDAAYRRKALHDALQDSVPPSLRKRFHVNLVVHGQRICLPRNPKCASCPVTAICKKVGVFKAPDG